MFKATYSIQKRDGPQGRRAVNCWLDGAEGGLSESEYSAEILYCKLLR